MTINELIAQAETARKHLGGDALVVLETATSPTMDDIQETYCADWPGCLVLSAKPPTD